MKHAHDRRHTLDAGERAGIRLRLAAIASNISSDSKAKIASDFRIPLHTVELLDAERIGTTAEWKPERDDLRELANFIAKAKAGVTKAAIIARAKAVCERHGIDLDE